jgi:hypothetical protein
MPVDFRREIERAIEEDDAEELQGVVIDVALASEDGEWALACLVRMSQHADPTVRGNALIGFSHLVGRFGHLDRSRIEERIEAGLKDGSQFVHEQAEAAREALAERARDERPATPIECGGTSGTGD